MDSQYRVTSDPQLATAAQVPLQGFSIPPFPPETSSTLKSLTLTSDINPNDYTSLLGKDRANDGTFSIPSSLPASVETLTLELFSLGYPPGFLEQLSSRMKNVKSLIVYSQIIQGISDASTKDAVLFFENLRYKLKAMHLLDVFARKGFWLDVGRVLTGADDAACGLLFLEISYTTHASDPSFLSSVHGAELPALVQPSLLACTFNISPPVATNDPQDPTNLDENGEPIDRGASVSSETKTGGIKAFDTEASKILIEKLTGNETAPRQLKMLNSTLYSLELEQLVTILKKHPGLAVLNVTVLAPSKEPSSGNSSEEPWNVLLWRCLGLCPGLEQIEIVMCPRGEITEVSDIDQDWFPSTKEVERVARDKLKKISSFQVNVLKNPSWGSANWEKVGDSWKGGFQPGTA